MAKILITGATGNVGRAVLQHLDSTQNELHAAVHTIYEEPVMAGETVIRQVAFDFTKTESFADILAPYDRLFLLRPPQISDVDKVFRPLIHAAKAADVKFICFLSVQGAEKSSWIPHHKIEKLIVESGIPHTMIRPGYFMQNLTSTLLSDLQQHRTIVLPAGKAVFNWVDVKDVGEIAALALEHPDRFAGDAIEVTGPEQLSFHDVGALLRELVDPSITYRSVNLVKFFLHERKKSTPIPFIFVMMVLHYLPRLQGVPSLSAAYQDLTGKAPNSIRAFLREEETQRLLAVNHQR
jgi:uncharacterized protein YbjT (DUF2867 family)